jgi:putative transposase
MIFLKKTLISPVEERKKWINADHSDLSIRQQSKLLQVNRSSLYYVPVEESEYNIMLMNKLDEQYTKTPFYGVEKMTVFLNEMGHHVNVKRVRRLLRTMGLEAIYPKPNLSRLNSEHKIYPYLLRNMKIVRCNQVWSTDITYIRLQKGFVYLMAIIDWYSRYVINWRVSTTLEADFCIETLTETLYNTKCEIFNTDQGSQFTTKRFIKPLLDQGIKVSMDGRGRALDNIFIERLWRSVKYENIYIKEYDTVRSVKKGLHDYFEFYNHERYHESLGYKRPVEVYQK